MQIFVIGIILLLAILLIVVVLIQNPKGGLGGAFGGSGASQLMGVKKTGDILEKLTWGFALAIIVLCLVANSFLYDKNKLEDAQIMEDANIEAAKGSFAPATQEAAPAPEEGQATPEAAPDAGRAVSVR